jgi:hypothetical protein
MTAIVLGIIILSLMKRGRSLKGPSLKRITESWLHAENQANPVLRIVEADKILDEALKLLGFTGTLGEKLKAAGPRFSDLNSLWSAHKLRNTLVHELNSQPNESDVARAMNSFRQALKDLGMK